MYLYGSQRLTKDVDIIASGYLSLTPEHPLGFGGSSYRLQVGEHALPLDWIVRSGGYQKFYWAALQDAAELPNGLQITTPEWLTILKYNTGRQKDLDDIVFLLKEQEEQVNRPKLKQHVVATVGDDAWLTMMAEFRRLCELADSRTAEPSKYGDNN